MRCSIQNPQCEIANATLSRPASVFRNPQSEIENETLPRHCPFRKDRCERSSADTRQRVPPHSEIRDPKLRCYRLTGVRQTAPYAPCLEQHAREGSARVGEQQRGQLGRGSAASSPIIACSFSEPALKLLKTDAAEFSAHRRPSLRARAKRLPSRKAGIPELALSASLSLAAARPR